LLSIILRFSGFIICDNLPKGFKNVLGGSIFKHDVDFTWSLLRTEVACKGFGDPSDFYSSANIDFASFVIGAYRCAKLISFLNPDHEDMNL
jgi:hypothetical protein